MTRYTYRIEDSDDFKEGLPIPLRAFKRSLYVAMKDGKMCGWFLNRVNARAWCQQQETQG